MSLLRLLSAAAFASICVISAPAQTPAQTPGQTPAQPPATPTPPAATFPVPQYTFAQTSAFPTPKFTTPTPFLLTPQQPAPGPLSDLDKAKAGLAALQNSLPPSNDSCYTMRSYGFTARDLQSTTPRPSTATSCTPANTVKLKDATSTPFK